MTAALSLRPRGFSELIDATFAIVRARLSALATIGALMMLPPMTLTLVLLAGLPAASREAIRAGTVAAATAGQLPGWAIAVAIVSGLAAIVVYTLGFGALVTVASRAYLGQPVDVREALARGAARWWTLLFAGIQKYLLAFLIMLAGAIVFGIASAAIPALAFVLLPIGMFGLAILMTMWSMTTPVVMLEPVTAGQALGRSALLTKGRRVRLLGMFLVMLVLVWALLLVAVLVATFVARSPTVMQVMSNLVSVVLYPLFAVLATVVYYDLRIRNEGFDLEVMAAGLQGGSLPPASSAARQPA